MASDALANKITIISSAAQFSDCRQYRYTLSRRWSGGGGRGIVSWIGLNPSTADEVNNDPTVFRCIKRSQVLGYDAMHMLNAFAYRATDPKVMKQQTDPVGEENDYYIRHLCRSSDLVVACWGVHCVHQGREQRVLELLKDAGVKVHCLGVTKDGHPKHPLYLPYSAEPVLLGDAS